MSQFIAMIVREQPGNITSGVNLVPVEAMDDHVADVARNLFHGFRDRGILCAVDHRTGISDTIFTDAQRALNTGAQFEETRLCSLLDWICSNALMMCAWYGSEWSDLEVARTCVALRKIVKSQLDEVPGEVYVSFSMES